MIIGITGTLGAGKGTIVDYFVKKGFKHYSVRQFLIKEINKRNMLVNRDSMVYVANEIRQNNSPSYIAEELYESAKKEGRDCIIESLRTPGEIESLRKKGEFYLIAIDADPRIRYTRILKRDNETDNIVYEEFIENEKREMHSEDPNKQNLQKCIEMADFKIENNERIEDLHNKIEEIYKKITSQKIGIKPGKTEKRKDYISWDDYFMGIALFSAKRSKDPNTQVGACIVNPEKKVIGIGYNGFPTGCSDEELPWSREGSFLDTKYPYVCHAELNAIVNTIGKDLTGCTLYVGLFPCNECAKVIIQSGIKEVVYLSDKYADTDFIKASKILMNQSGVKYRRIFPSYKEIKIDFTET